MLYWVGCYGHFDDRNNKVARALVKCLQAANVHFAILGREEKCSGEPLRRMGNEYLYQMMVAENRLVDDIDRHGAGRLDLADSRRRPKMIANAISSAEAARGDDLFIKNPLSPESGKMPSGPSVP